MNTRGIRNKNPLNIRRVAGTTWRGQCGVQTDGQFVQFESFEWGFRAAFVTLRTYAVKYKAYSISAIINRWAPPTENDTQSYIRKVCLMTGFGGQQALSDRQWPQLVKAMAKIETGMDFSDEIIKRGFELIDPQAPSLALPQRGGRLTAPSL